MLEPDAGKLACPVLRRVGGGNAPRLSDQNVISSGFPERMYEYQYRIRDRYKMPVVAFAISSGTRIKPIPDQYNYALLGTSIHYQYNTFQIATQDENHLSESNNPFAMVVLIAKKAVEKGGFTDDYLLTQNTELAKLRFSKDFPQKTIRSIMNFLRHYVHFENSEYYANFDKEVALLTSNKKTMGIEELLLENAKKSGEKIGEKRGERIGEKRGERIGEKRERERAEKRAEKHLRKIVTNLIKDTDFDDKKIATLASVTTTFVAQVREELDK